jgi:hypothetical protein
MGVQYHRNALSFILLLLFSEKRRYHGPLPVKEWRAARESISAPMKSVLGWERRQYGNRLDE